MADSLFLQISLLSLFQLTGATSPNLLAGFEFRTLLDVPVNLTFVVLILDSSLITEDWTKMQFLLTTLWK